MTLNTISWLWQDWEREWEKPSEKEYVCERESERKKECVCVCVWERERESKESKLDENRHRVQVEHERGSVTEPNFCSVGWIWIPNEVAPTPVSAKLAEQRSAKLPDWETIRSRLFSLKKSFFELKVKVFFENRRFWGWGCQIFLTRSSWSGPGSYPGPSSRWASSSATTASGESTTRGDFRKAKSSCWSTWPTGETDQLVLEYSKYSILLSNSVILYWPSK